MVRMLGFTDEDKQRIGLAQQGNGKGVVRGVLGLPGRLVGGILGSGSETSTAMAPDDQVCLDSIELSSSFTFFFPLKVFKCTLGYASLCAPF